MSETPEKPVETDPTENNSHSGKTKPVRKRLIKSISHRMMFNYFFYAAAILALLWVVFFVCIFNFYSAIVKDDVRRVGGELSAAFPKRIDDNSMKLYRMRLRDVAHENGVSVLLFELAENGAVYVLEVVDVTGESTEFETPVNTAMFNDIFDNVAIDGGVGKAEVESCDYIYYLSEHVVESDIGSRTLTMVVLKQYSVFNYQTNKLILILVLCTVVVLASSCGFAYVAGRVQTKCLIDFSKNAKRVADGDYDVKYSGYGYTEYEILASALNDATESVKSAEKLQRDFIANVSHDIRTPITIIRAYAEMLRDFPQNDEKRKKTAETIISEADKLTSLTNDVLNYSRLSSGVTEFNFEPTDISAVARSVLTRFDYFVERDGMKFVNEISDGMIVSCDKNHIEQVLYNLISNACNYCGDDKTVIVRVFDKNGVARVEVEDHGKGIAPEDIDAVWNRYYRDAHAKRRTVGTGLGLSICDNILKAHNAQFGVVSTLGKGSTFWFELDIKRPARGGGILISDNSASN